MNVLLDLSALGRVGYGTCRCAEVRGGGAFKGADGAAVEPADGGVAFGAAGVWQDVPWASRTSIPLSDLALAPAFSSLRLNRQSAGLGTGEYSRAIPGAQ